MSATQRIDLRDHSPTSSFRQAHLMLAYNELVSTIESALHRNGLSGKFTAMQVVMAADELQVSVLQFISALGVHDALGDVLSRGGANTSNMARLRGVLSNALVPDVPTLTREPDRAELLHRLQVLVDKQLPVALTSLTLNWANQLLEDIRQLSSQIKAIEPSVYAPPEPGSSTDATTMLLKAVNAVQQEEARRSEASQKGKGLTSAQQASRAQNEVLRTYYQSIAPHAPQGVLLDAGWQVIQGTIDPHLKVRLFKKAFFEAFTQTLHTAWQEPAVQWMQRAHPDLVFSEGMQFLLSPAGRALLLSGFGSELSKPQQNQLRIQAMILDLTNLVGQQLKEGGQPDGVELNVLQRLIDLQLVANQTLQPADVLDANFLRDAAQRLSGLKKKVIEAMNRLGFEGGGG